MVREMIKQGLREHVYDRVIIHNNNERVVINRKKEFLPETRPFLVGNHFHPAIIGAVYAKPIPAPNTTAYSAMKEARVVA